MAHGTVDGGAFLRNVVLGVIALLCSACTHLQTNPTGEVPSIAPGQSASAGAQRGISYALPMVQFDLKMTRALDSCPEDAPPVFTVKVEAQERYVAGERFEVDYQAMSSPFKTTGFDISFHESGTIHTINARAQDQTGTVLTNVARVGLAVAAVASGNPLGTLALAPVPTTAGMESQNLSNVQSDIGRLRLELRCSAEARRTLADLAAATDEVKTLTRNVANQSDRVTRFSALAALHVLSADDRIELSTTVRNLLDAESQLRTANARVSALQESLSASEQLRWPTEAGDISGHSGLIGPNEESLHKLVGLLDTQISGSTPHARPQSVPQSSLASIRVTCHPNEEKGAEECLRERLAELVTLNFALIPTITQATAAQQGHNPQLQDAIIPNGDRRWARGVFVREPVDARLVVCGGGATVESNGCSDGQGPVFSGSPIIAPQLGRLRLLPFRSRAFENNHLQLSVRANGFIEQFSYGEESSAAAATGTLADIAERTQNALEAMETERRSDIQYARDTRTYERSEASASRAEELAQLNHQLDMIKAQRDLSAAQASAPNQSSVVQANADRARVDSEVQLLQSQIARLRAANELAALSSP
jgi:hypothetical protein